MKLSDKATYVYIKHIKKWIECPVCNRRMIFNKSQKAWICKRCDYEILESEYLDDFIFWFCDECNSYLNCQEGFDKKSAKHICQKCGYENDTTSTNIKGCCINCGTTIPNSNTYLCEGCKKERNKKIIKTATAVVTTAVVTGTTSLLLGGESDFENWVKNASDEELEEGYEERRKEWAKNGFGGNGEKTPEMKRIDREISDRMAVKWENDPRRNRDPNYRWTDANRWDKD